MIKLPRDVEKRFNEQLPADRVIVKHVATLHGVKIMSERTEQVEAIDREKVKQFIAKEIQAAKEEGYIKGAKDEREQAAEFLHELTNGHG